MKRRPTSQSRSDKMWSGARSRPPSEAKLLGIMYERDEKGDRHFYGTIAGMLYLLTPASSKKAAATRERKWKLHVLPLRNSRIKSQ